MTAERWELVKNLFESALTISPEERAAYVKARCGADDEVLREVASLLESVGEDDKFLEEPVMSVADVVEVPEPSPDLSGVRVGAYELVREIGRGGMGAVYLAVRADNEFKKRVAIKLIRGGMESEFIIRRFRNERQILARLEHPNIARLIDGGTTTDGLPYFVMEYVEGEPLIQYCLSRSLPVRERLEIFSKACSAVHYAHRRMIIHRDLKPGNILVKQDGTPKLLDFGIAKLMNGEAADSLAETMGGFRIVTPAYASPEQMRGEPATVCSDVYALGIILFELIAGHRPSNAAGLDPLALPAESGDTERLLSTQLRAVVHRAVQPDPRERYESVEAFAADIRACAAGTPIPDYGAAPTAEERLGAPADGSVAVLPFRLLGADSTTDGYLGLGITDALITKLSNVGRISVRSTSAVMRYGPSIDSLTAGRELGVQFVLEGRIQRPDNRVRVTVQLVNARTGAPAWAASFDDNFDDLLRMEDSISEQVAQALVPHLTGEERKQLARAGTQNPKAHQAYLRGRWHWNKGTADSLAQALLAFMQAIAQDPEYALAHAGVADYYVQLGMRGGLPPAESFAAAKDSAATALRIDSSLAEAQASLGFALWAHDRDHAGAAHRFQLAIALNPDYAPAHHWLGLLNSSLGRPEMAVACLERARKLDPNRAVFAAALALCHYNARRFGRAIDCCLESLRTVGESCDLQALLALSYHADGQGERALEAAHKAAAGDCDLAPLCVVAEVEARNGLPRRARALLADLEARSEATYMSGCIMAALYEALGERQKALAQLERALRDRDWWAMWLAIGPRWDSLRGDPKFDQLLLAPRADAEPPRTHTKPHTPVQRRRTFWTASAVAALLLIALIAAYLWLKPPPIPFQQIAITKLTTNGTALRAAISPDARYVAYTSAETGSPVLSVREVNGSTAYPIAGPFQGEVRALEFIREGKYVSFLVYPANEPAKGILYAAPIGGGALETLMSDVPGPVTVSADGAQLAYYSANPGNGTDDLFVRSAPASEARKVASRRYPDRFSMDSAPAWSFDGKRLACAMEGTDATGFRVTLATVDEDGSMHAVNGPRFQWIGRVAWLKDGQGLLVIGQEHDSSFEQIWYVPLGKGKAVRLTNDLNEYHALSASADGAALVSVQSQTLAKLYVLNAGLSASPQQITPASGRYFDLSWTPSGEIVYASDATGSAVIWTMKADGSGQQPLIAGVGRSYSPAVSPDGRSIAFHSNRDGNWNIWWMDLAARTPVQLTRGTRDSNWPQFTPDGKAVIYHHTGLNALFGLWKTPVEGGPAQRITNRLTMHPAVSAQDGRIACWYSEDAAKPNWKVAILAPQGGDAVRLFDVPETVTYDSRLRWTPKSNGITYIDMRNGAANLWVQPMDGTPAHALTAFTSGQIFSFDWSRDGRLVYSRGMTTSDVVLIRSRK